MLKRGKQGPLRLKCRDRGRCSVRMQIMSLQDIFPLASLVGGIYCHSLEVQPRSEGLFEPQWTNKNRNSVANY